jgi:hypothetical protein
MDRRQFRASLEQVSGTSPRATQSSSSAFINQLITNEDIQIHGNVHTFCNFQRERDDNDSEDAKLDDFKNKVKIWMRLDNETKELTAKIKMLEIERKQRRKYMDSLGPFIMDFMSQNDIEELNSKDGRLLYKSSFVKVPLSNALVRTKLYERFPTNHAELDKIFVDREKTKKVTLKRIA